MLKVVPLDGRCFIQFFIVVWCRNFINQTCSGLKRYSITFIMQFIVRNLTKFCGSGGISKFNHLALSMHIQMHIYFCLLYIARCGKITNKRQLSKSLQHQRHELCPKLHFSMSNWTYIWNCTFLSYSKFYIAW